MKHTEYGYGAFPDGDPRRFYPDPEVCTEKEIAAHNAPCKRWNEAELRGEELPPDPCPSEWILGENGAIAHVLRSSFGLGSYEYEAEEESR